MPPPTLKSIGSKEGFIYYYVYVCVYMNCVCHAGAHGGQKTTLASCTHILQLYTGSKSKSSLQEQYTLQTETEISLYPTKYFKMISAHILLFYFFMDFLFTF